MEETIKVDLTQFDETRATLFSARVTMEASVVALKKASAALIDSFQGSGGRAFQSASEYLESIISESNSKLEKMIKNVDIIEHKFSNLDQELADALKES